MATDTELAWCAGIIEGEACILISRIKSGPYAGRGHGLRIMVANTDCFMVVELRRLLGGTLAPKTRQRSHWKPAWVWSICGRHAAAALAAMLPFMRTTKKKQAELAIEYAAKYSHIPGEKGRTPEQLEEQRWFYEQMTNLKLELPASLAEVET